MKYVVKFKREMIAEVLVEAETSDKAIARFHAGEWSDHYDTLEIKRQHVIDVKEETQRATDAKG